MWVWSFSFNSVAVSLGAVENKECKHFNHQDHILKNLTNLEGPPSCVVDCVVGALVDGVVSSACSGNKAAGVVLHSPFVGITGSEVCVVKA